MKLLTVLPHTMLCILLHDMLQAGKFLKGFFKEKLSRRSLEVAHPMSAKHLSSLLQFKEM